MTSLEWARLFMKLYFIFFCLKCITCEDGLDLCGETCTCSNFIMDCRMRNLDKFPSKIHKDVKAIYLDNNRMKDIGQLPEEAELQTLYMSHNKIANLSYDAFDNLDNLNTLVLSYNEISTIADDIFEWNPLNLQVLHLDHNKMEFIQHFLFYDLEKLTELYLQNNNITFIHPHAFLQLKNLRRLRLDGNKLHTFNHKWVEKLQSNGLSELRFDNNPWSCDCAMLEPQKWLKQEEKSKWFHDLTTSYPVRCQTPTAHFNKSVIELESKNLEGICDKPVITGISSAAEIPAGRNVLLRCVVDDTKYPVPTLSWTAPNGDIYRLNTADNFEGVTVHQDGSLLITTLKDSDKGTYTCTATNKAGSFSANTKITVTGKTGDIHPSMPPHTEITRAPLKNETKDTIKACPAVCQCVSRHIDCASDGTKKQPELPKDIPADAVSISFATNSLTKLAANAFVKFKDLEELRLDNNDISDIDSMAFAGLDKLSTLTLRENEIKRIVKGTFSPLKKLKVLVLDKNKLTKINNEMFKGLVNVQWLYIRENLIKTVSDDAFTALTSIKFIHLESNQIEVIYPETVNSLTTMTTTKIQKVFVDENPFHCDCNMEKLRLYVQDGKNNLNFPDLFADGVICSFPADFSGEELVNVKEPLQCSKDTIIDASETTSHYSGLLFGGIALGVVITIVLFILWRKYGRRARTLRGKSYNYSNLNGTDDGERSALTTEGLGSSGTEAFV